MIGKTLELEKGVTAEVFKEKEAEEVKLIKIILNTENPNFLILK